MCTLGRSVQQQKQKYIHGECERVFVANNNNSKLHKFPKIIIPPPKRTFCCWWASAVSVFWDRTDKKATSAIGRKIESLLQCEGLASRPDGAHTIRCPPPSAAAAASYSASRFILSPDGAQLVRRHRREGIFFFPGPTRVCLSLWQRYPTCVWGSL